MFLGVLLNVFTVSVTTSSKSYAVTSSPMMSGPQSPDWIIRFAAAGVLPQAATEAKNSSRVDALQLIWSAL